MKIVVDMNLSRDWVSGLRQAGIEATHWTEVGPEDAADETIMAWAQTNDAVVLTRDLDFAAALTMLRLNSPSVVQLRADQTSPGRHLPLVKQVLSLHSEALGHGAIITVEDGRVRIRKLSPED